MTDRDSEWRQERIAENEASFRRINERLEADLGVLTTGDDRFPFICECGSRICQHTVELTLSEYEAVRSRPDHFAVLPGHVFPEAETVVVRNERYCVVEKRGLGADLSRESDPRAASPFSEHPRSDLKP